MIINRSFSDFKFRHRGKKNQIIYTSESVKKDDDILNLAIELVRSGSSKEEIKNKTGLNDSEIETIYAYHKNVKN